MDACPEEFAHLHLGPCTKYLTKICLVCSLGGTRAWGKFG